MVDPNDLRVGMEVRVKLPRHDEPRRAIVRKVPPYTETFRDTTREITDKVRVQYPNTALDGRGGLFGDFQEDVDIGCVLEP